MGGEAGPTAAAEAAAAELLAAAAAHDSASTGWRRGVRWPPRRRDAVRVLKALLLVWAQLLIAWFRPSPGALVQFAVFAQFVLPAGSPFRVLVVAAVAALGMVGGLCLSLLGQLWVVAYNNNGGTSPYARAAVLTAWIGCVVWASSGAQYARLNGPLGALGFFVTMMFAVTVEPTIAVLELDAVPVRAEFDSIMVVLLTGVALYLGVGLLVLPESATEAARESAVRLTRSLRAIGSGGIGPDSPPEHAAASAARDDAVDLLADARGCPTDIGFFRDAPRRMALLAAALAELGRRMRPGAANPTVAALLDSVHDALVVDQPPYLPAFWNYARPRRLGGAEQLDAVRARIADDREAVLAARGGAGAADDPRALALYTVLESADRVAEAAQDLVGARNGGHRFYAFDRARRTQAQQQPQQKADDPDVVRPASSGGWKPGRLVIDGLYLLQQAISSDAGRFGFKRAFAFAIISVWAFLPGTSEAFVRYHVYWLLVSAVVLLAPTIGAGVVGSGLRLLATCAAVLWGYFAYLAWLPYGTEQGRAGVALAFFVPVSILGFCMQNWLPHPYAGRMFSVTYIAVTLGSGDALADPAFGAFRAGMMILSVLALLLYQIAVFPTLSATDVRVGLGNLLYCAARLLRRAEAGDPAARTGTDALSSRLAVLARTSLAAARGEPLLDRPWDRRWASAACECVHRMLASLSSLADYAARGGEAPAWTAPLLDEAAAKLHTLAVALVAKRPLPRMFPLPARAVAPAPAASGPRAVLAAGGGAALAVLLGDVDAMEVLVGNMFGRQAVPAGSDDDAGYWLLGSGPMQQLEPRQPDRTGTIPLQQDLE
ncbi:hypothetical protein DFJ74DRAFT_753123 [Hyaloraphidium curvatum]|nr:hypothetical protein DFJ74DRAFT_753123 [Hyaloraphidium curvatum]